MRNNVIPYIFFFPYFLHYYDYYSVTEVENYTQKPFLTLLQTVSNSSPQGKIKSLQRRISEDVLKEHVFFWPTVMKCVKSPKIIRKIKEKKLKGSYRIVSCFLVFIVFHGFCKTEKNIFSVGNIKSHHTKNAAACWISKLPATLWLFKEQILSNDHEVYNIRGGKAV